MRDTIRFETVRQKPSLPFWGWVVLVVALLLLWHVGSVVWRISFPREENLAHRAEQREQAAEAAQIRQAEAQAERAREEAERVERAQAEAVEATARASARASLDAVRNSLRDPYSVQFRNVWVVRITYGTARATAVCGLFNARNGFGGYVGERPFVAVGRLAWQPGDQRFEEYFRQFCQDGERWFEVRP